MAAIKGRGWRRRARPRVNAPPSSGLVVLPLTLSSKRWPHGGCTRRRSHDFRWLQSFRAALDSDRRSQPSGEDDLSIFYFLLARGLGRVRVLDFFPDLQRIGRVLRSSFGFFGVSHSDPLESIIFLSHLFPKH
jgi:hypothetical protein